MTERLEFVIGAKDQFSGSFSKLQSALPSIRRAAIAASAAFAGMGAAMFAMTKTTATAYDKVQKLSDRLGVSTQFLSKMAHAAELSGINIEVMHKAVEMLSVRIQEANKCTGLAVEAFEKLNIKLTDANGNLRTSDDVLPDLAEAFKSLTNATERTAAAYQIFGMRGTAMLQMFKDGKAGLEAMTEEAEKFGLVISKEAGENAAAFNDSLTRLTGSLRGVKNTFAEQLMPILTKGFNNLANIIANNRDKIVGSLRYMADAMITFSDVLLNAASFAGAGIGAIVQGISKLVGAYQKLVELEMKVMEFIGADKARNSLSLLAAKIQYFRDSLDNSRDSIDAYIVNLENLRSSVSAFFTDMMDIEGGTIPGLPPEDKQTEIYDKALENHEKYLAYVAALNSQYGELTIQNAIYVAEREKEIAQLKSDALKDITANLYSAMNYLGKDYFELMKNIQTVDAIISTYVSAQKAYESVVWIPGVGPALAVAAAAAAIVAGMARVAQIRAQEYPSAHGGMSNVPKEQTYLLDAGERVLSPNQNADLKQFMSENQAPQVTGSTFKIDFPNTDLSSMSKSQAEDFAENVMAPALKKLATQGLY